MKYYTRLFAYSYYFSRLATPSRFSGLYESRAIFFFAACHVMYFNFIFSDIIVHLIQEDAFSSLTWTIVNMCIIIYINYKLERKYGENIEEIKKINISIIEKIFSVIIHTLPIILLFVSILNKPN